jgi:Tfp pilus assembly protein PilF
MKLYNFFIKYRFLLGVVTLVLAIAANIVWSFWPSLALYIIAVVAIFTHFFIGPLRLIQEYLEGGDFEGAEKILNGIKYPALLYKPIRSVYYTLKGNIAMTQQDYDSAEKHMKKSLDLGLPMKEAEGANKLQLGMMAMQRGNMKEGESLIRSAIRVGIPDKESSAMAYLQMCQIMMQKREFRAAKDFFKKAKAQKPTTEQVVDQIKQIEKYISRMPG